MINAVDLFSRLLLRVRSYLRPVSLRSVFSLRSVEGSQGNVDGEEYVFDSSHILSPGSSNPRAGHAALKGSSNGTSVVILSLALNDFPTKIFLSAPSA